MKNLKWQTCQNVAPTALILQIDIIKSLAVIVAKFSD